MVETRDKRTACGKPPYESQEFRQSLVLFRVPARNNVMLKQGNFGEFHEVIINKVLDRIKGSKQGGGAGSEASRIATKDTSPAPKLKVMQRDR